MEALYLKMTKGNLEHERFVCRKTIQDVFLDIGRKIWFQFFPTFFGNELCLWSCKFCYANVLGNKWDGAFLVVRFMVHPFSKITPFSHDCVFRYFTRKTGSKLTRVESIFHLKEPRATLTTLWME